MSALVQSVDHKADTVNQAARRALQKASGDTAKAISFMAENVRKDRALRDAILEPLVEYACGNAINQAIRQDRSKNWNAPAVHGGMSQADRVRVLAAGTLAMFLLPGGTKLGEASRQQVAEAAEFYAKQSQDMGHKARWLQLVAQSLPNDKKVGEVLSDERLSALKEEALNA